jgi:hypothetical protein
MESVARLPSSEGPVHRWSNLLNSKAVLANKAPLRDSPMSRLIRSGTF